MQRNADGFPATPLLDAVAEHLSRTVPELEPCVYHTGGGIMAVQVSVGDKAVFAGGDEGTWLYDVMDNSGDLLDGGVLELPTGAVSAETVATELEKLARTLA